MNTLTVLEAKHLHIGKLLLVLVDDIVEVRFFASSFRYVRLFTSFPVQIINQTGNEKGSKHGHDDGGCDVSSRERMTRA